MSCINEERDVLMSPLQPPLPVKIPPFLRIKYAKCIKCAECIEYTKCIEDAIEPIEEKVSLPPKLKVDTTVRVCLIDGKWFTGTVLKNGDILPVGKTKPVSMQNIVGLNYNNLHGLGCTWSNLAFLKFVSYEFLCLCLCR